MRDLQGRLNSIDQEIHTLETATPRNSATVDRGSLRVVDEGAVILAQGGTVFFGEGGSAISGDYSIEDSAGWQIGTERRGSSIVVLNDIPGVPLTVTTANSSVLFEEIILDPEAATTVELNVSGSAIVQLFDVVDTKGSLTIGGTTITPTPVYKSSKEQWAYSYMNTIQGPLEISTDIPGLVMRVARLSVNNAS